MCLEQGGMCVGSKVRSVAQAVPMIGHGNSAAKAVMVSQKAKKENSAAVCNCALDKLARHGSEQKCALEHIHRMHKCSSLHKIKSACIIWGKE